jgi:hypothetical protein
MKKFIPKLKKTKNYWLGPVLIVILSILAYFPLLKPGYFSMHDDVQIMRLYEMERCLKDGQIPCRWVPDMGAGYGHPLFNYHPVFTYYLGMVFRLFNLSLINISKLLFLLTLVLSGLSMYFLTREFFGNLAGTVAAVFFVYAPYHAVDIYVRGALTESWAIVFFPLIFFSLYKFIKEEKFNFFILSIFSLTFLFLSHNVMTLIFTPVALLWSLYWLFVKRKKRSIKKIVLIFLWAFGLAAFFLIPAFFEKSLVKIETLTSDYYNFRYHFVTIRQLFFDRSWGYGPSRPGVEDGMSFQLGWPHWWLAIVSGLTIVYLFLKKKRNEEFYALLFSIFYFLFSIFMTHAKSIYLWEAIPILSFVQFPWRFLGIAMFASSFMAGGVVNLLKDKWRIIAVSVLILAVVALNAGYFHPEEYFSEMTEQKKLAGEEWKIQSMATLMDYIPRQVKEFPKELAPKSPWVVEGEARVTEFRKRSNFWRFTVDVIIPSSAHILIPVFNFPRWQVLIDQQPVLFTDNNSLGIIEVEVPSGKHTVVGWFENTPLRVLANSLSLISFAALVLAVIWQETKNEKNS